MTYILFLMCLIGFGAGCGAGIHLKALSEITFYITTFAFIGFLLLFYGLDVEISTVILSACCFPFGFLLGMDWYKPVLKFFGKYVVGFCRWMQYLIVDK